MRPYLVCDIKLLGIVFKSKGFVKHKRVKVSDKKEQRFGDIVSPKRCSFLSLIFTCFGIIWQEIHVTCKRLEMPRNAILDRSPEYFQVFECCMLMARIVDNIVVSVSLSCHQ